MAETIYALEWEEGSTTEVGLERDLLLLGETLATRLRATIEELRAEGPARVSDLTDIQIEVLLAFIDGFGIRRVAERLAVEMHTIRDHLAAIARKIGVDSERELRELFSPEPFDEGSG